MPSPPDATAPEPPDARGADFALQPRALFSIFGNFNTICGVCESSTTDDAPALWLCSFCNLSYHNSTECLGKAGGEIVATHFVENEASE